MQYKDIIRQIVELPWNKAAPADLVLISRAAAMEFSSSLRLASGLFKNDPRLKEMSEGELATTNLVFEEYNQKGDHWEYLDYFIRKMKISTSSKKIILGIRDYIDAVEALSPVERVMTVFSREEELTQVFKEILKAHNWDSLGYGFYRHYLEAHILLDSADGGHHNLVSHVPLNEDVLNIFYKMRLKLYETLFD